MAQTNHKKSAALAKGFFLPKLLEDELPQGYRYPHKCARGPRITAKQIHAQLWKLKPYKVPGPDGIPNIVLTKCVHILTKRLLCIYEAMYEHNLLYKLWKEFMTVVLRKPGKPQYNVPKAYRPITLLNTMWKVLMAIVAAQLTYVTEKHQLLPPNHFGGRPGRTTTDAMNLLAYKVKDAWRAGKVTSVLFLDVEGAFPNAIPSQLEHNLCKRKIPKKITNFIHSMLWGQVTALRFDGYTSEPIKIDNGIGQGDLLSMVMYQYYNADLLDIPKDESEEAIAYVDDVLMLATASTFHEAHNKLAEMMTREGGVVEWSIMHNSCMELTKLALVDFVHRSNTEERVPLHLPDSEVKPLESAKYLGVILNQHLDWRAQYTHTLGKGTKWAMQI